MRPSRIRRTALVTAVVAFAVATPAHAQFSFEASSETLASALTPDPNQAGGHPDFRVHLDVPRRPGTDQPVGTIRDVQVDLPAGLIGDPQAVPTCTMGRINDFQNQCPTTTAVGEVLPVIANPPDQPPLDSGYELLYRVTPEPGEAAAFGMQAEGFPVRFAATVGPDGGYRLRVTSLAVPETLPVLSFDLRLWGVPSEHQAPGDKTTRLYQIPFGAPRTSGEDVGRPFLNAPSVCDGEPLRTDLAITPWQDRSLTVSRRAAASPVTGCDKQAFDPTVAATPDNRNAGQPTGLTVTIDVPQTATRDRLATPPLKDARIALPEGMAISPAGADGLAACTDDQLAASSNAPDTCPDASKIGTVRIDTPLLEQPVLGAIHIGTQQSSDPASGRLYRLFLTAYASGVAIKLPGGIAADPATGRLTATFADNPRLPFSRLTLHFKDGDRAPLVNASACGTRDATGTLTSWGGPAPTLLAPVSVDGACPTGVFAPRIAAGTVDRRAGAFSPLLISIARADADRDLGAVRVDLPPGLLAALGSVPVCADALADSGACAAESRLGAASVAVGSGGSPLRLPGSVALAGPHQGAPFSLSIVVPAKVGPFDLGTVVVRAPLLVDAARARATAVVPALPRIVGGVPLHYRSIGIVLDRPGFSFNATSCSVRTVGLGATATDGTQTTTGTPYQPTRCDALRLKPTLRLALGERRELRKGGHPSLTAELRQAPGQANLRSVRVTLPLSIALDADNARGLCKPAEALTASCPASSIVGSASATTPALHEPLSGPVFFIERTRRTASGKQVRTLPGLLLRLQGDGVTLWLTGAASVAKGQQLVTTFGAIPDAPIRSFRLQVDGGRNGILAAVRDPCTAGATARSRFVGHNRGTKYGTPALRAAGCRPRRR